MILGIEIENFDVFDKDKAGILIDDFLADRDRSHSRDGLRGLNAFGRTALRRYQAYRLSYRYG